MMMWPHSGRTYGVLTHHQLIDPGVGPQSSYRFYSRMVFSTSLTTEHRCYAHACAYGGCIVQDFGYYPFANAFFYGSDACNHAPGILCRSSLSTPTQPTGWRSRSARCRTLCGRQYWTFPRQPLSVAIIFPKLNSKSHGSSVRLICAGEAPARWWSEHLTPQAANLQPAPATYVRDFGLLKASAAQATRRRVSWLPWNSPSRNRKRAASCHENVSFRLRGALLPNCTYAADGAA